MEFKLACSTSSSSSSASHASTAVIHSHAHSATQPMPQGGMMIPVMIRTTSHTSGQDNAGSRRMSGQGLPVRLSAGGGGSQAPSPAPPPLHLPHGGRESGGLISPHSSHRHLPTMSRSPFHSSASPRMSPSTTPSPTHAGHPPLHGATQGQVTSFMPPAAMLSPTQSAPSPSPSPPQFTSPTSATSPRRSTGSYSPSSGSPRR